MTSFERSVGRRGFLKGSAAAAATVATAGLFGCAPQQGSEPLNATGEGSISHVVASDAEVLAEGAQWKAVDCWHNCGGRCINKVLMKDDVVIRHKTDDDYEDTDDLPQQRGCLRGIANVQQVYNVDRIKYPMKRKNWQPGGGDNVNGELRGRDKWERLSWDDALGMVAEETKRIYDTYGPTSVVCAYPASHNLFNLMGGSITNSGTMSYGHWTLCQAPIGIEGSPYYLGADMNNTNDRRDMVNADVIVLYGMNLAWASTTSTFYFQKAREAGVEFVTVGPSYSLGAAAVDARWIRVRPGSDTAFLLAVAYEMIRLEEEKGNIIDWDFLHTYAVGFGAESMPADAKLNENSRGYVLGEYDGIPKTPEWATEICGTPVEDITWYAETVGKQQNVMLYHSYVPARYNGAENLSQLFLTIACMGGHIGKSGNGCGAAYHSRAGNDGRQLIQYGNASAMGFVPNPIEKSNICAPEFWTSLLEGKYVHRGSAANMAPHNAFAPEEVIEFEPKMFYNWVSNTVESRMNVGAAVEALQKMDFVLCVEYASSMSAQYADIVLPCTTPWEGNLDPDKGEMWVSTSLLTTATAAQRRDCLIFPVPVIDALYEAKPEDWIYSRLAERLGFDPTVLYPISTAQTYFDKIAGSTVLGVDGETWETLVTITQEDIDRWGVVGEPQEGKIGLQELLDEGSYRVAVPQDDPVYGFIGYKDFIDDPVANPRPSVSGKFEIYSQAKADEINIVNSSIEPIKPYPTYIRAQNNYEDTFSNWETKEKGAYTFQMYQPHYLGRSHTEFDNCDWTTEAFADPFFINTEDAEVKGIKTGDTVRIFNDQGQILRCASVLSSIMPGCVACPHGARTNIDPETGLDRGGNENVLLGLGQSSVYFKQAEGYNSCLVDFELYDGEAVLDKCERARYTVEEA